MPRPFQIVATASSGEFYGISSEAALVGTGDSELHNDARLFFAEMTFNPALSVSQTAGLLCYDGGSSSTTKAAIAMDEFVFEQNNGFIFLNFGGIISEPLNTALISMSNITSCTLGSPNENSASLTSKGKTTWYPGFSIKEGSLTFQLSKDNLNISNMIIPGVEQSCYRLSLRAPVKLNNNSLLAVAFNITSTMPCVVNVNPFGAPA